MDIMRRKFPTGCHDAITVGTNHLNSAVRQQHALGVMDVLVLMRCQNDGLPTLDGHALDGLIEQQPSHLGVNGGQRIVQNQDVSIAVQRSRQTNPRSLSTGALHATITDHRLITVNELLKVGNEAAGLDHHVVPVAFVVQTHGDVLLDGAVHDPWILRCVRQRVVIATDRALRWWKLSDDGLEYRTFAAPDGTDDARQCPLFKVNRGIRQGGYQMRCGCVVSRSCISVLLVLAVMMLNVVPMACHMVHGKYCGLIIVIVIIVICTANDAFVIVITLRRHFGKLRKFQILLYSANGNVALTQPHHSQRKVLRHFQLQYIDESEDGKDVTWCQYSTRHDVNDEDD
mmetsp:Transcript_10452/g.29850  ORF Transcript_10452/g.29850 Transcript_10452/m.29850 type:complete len:343 (-) Transcript_10452:1319-2347(-)